MLNNNISAVVPILQWRPCRFELESIHNAYLDLLCDHLGVFTARASNEHKNLTETFLAEFSELDKNLLSRWLTAPEISNSIFYRNNRHKETLEFFINTIRAEKARSNPQSAWQSRLWTAVGDFSIEPQPETERAFTTFATPDADGIPVDFISPFALKISIRNFEADERGDEDVELFAPDELKDALAQVFDALWMIKSIDDWVSEFVRAFTKVLVLRKDTLDINSFSSASSGQFVGRSLIVNAHNKVFGGGILTDAVVHEAIHSLLYMLERKYPWVTSRELFFDRSARVVSPWSGRSLRLRPFLQANFVWFGLLHFWSSHNAEVIFDKQTAKWFANRAEEGFKKGRLVDRVKPYIKNLDAELLETIDCMQKLIALNFS